MKKILFLIPNLGHGGAEKVLVNLVNNMDQSKFQITVMTLYDEGVNKETLAAHIIYKSCFKSSFPGVSHALKLLSPEKLYSRFIKEQYDVVISYLEGQTARIISGCNVKNTKLVSWIHVEQHTAKNAARAFKSIREMKKCYQKFDLTVGVSEYVKKDFLSIVPVEKAIVLYNTVESEKIRDLSYEKIDNQIFNENEFKICNVGTLKPSKGFDRLLRIHNRLSKEGYPVHTYILGEGPEEKKLREMARVLGNSNSISFLGYQTNPYKYVRNCDLLVCSSFAEGFSTAATEALIVGTPVCTVEVSGMKEMLGENNEYGIITNNDEESLYLAIRSLLDDSALLEKYKKQAIMRGNIFSTENTVKEVEGMISRLMEREEND